MLDWFSLLASSGGMIWGDGWRLDIKFVVLRAVACATLVSWAALCCAGFMTGDILGHGICIACGRGGGSNG